MLQTFETSTLPLTPNATTELERALALLPRETLQNPFKIKRIEINPMINLHTICDFKPAAAS